MANVDPDQMPFSVASALALHYLQRSLCPNTWLSWYMGHTMPKRSQGLNVDSACPDQPVSPNDLSRTHSS